MVGRPSRFLRKLRLVDDLAPSLTALEDALEALSSRARTSPARVEELDRALTRLYSVLFLRVDSGPGLIDRVEALEEQLEGSCRRGEGVLARLEALEAELAKGGRR